MDMHIFVLLWDDYIVTSRTQVCPSIAQVCPFKAQVCPKHNLSLIILMLSAYLNCVGQQKCCDTNACTHDINTTRAYLFFVQHGIGGLKSDVHSKINCTHQYIKKMKNYITTFYFNETWFVA